jgi:two-component system response regulator RegA
MIAGGGVAMSPTLCPVGSSKDILVVDDEKDVAVTCARLLRRRGYAVPTAGSLRRRVDRAPAGRPSPAVPDLGLPDGDGLTIVRAARALPTPATVIVTTGFGSSSIGPSAQEAGASAYPAKPFSVHDFTALVDQRPAGVADQPPQPC